MERGLTQLRTGEKLPWLRSGRTSEIARKWNMLGDTHFAKATASAVISTSDPSKIAAVLAGGGQRQVVRKQPITYQP